MAAASVNLTSDNEIMYNVVMLSYDTTFYLGLSIIHHRSSLALTHPRHPQLALPLLFPCALAPTFVAKSTSFDSVYSSRQPCSMCYIILCHLSQRFQHLRQGVLPLRLSMTPYSQDIKKHKDRLILTFSKVTRISF